MTDALSAADVMALTRGDDDRNDMWNNPFVYLVWIWAFSAFGGGFGGFGGNNSATQGALTRAELYDGFTMNNVERQIQGVQNGLCDGFYAQNSNMLQGFNGIDRALCNGFNDVNANITQARFDSQQCCCETNRNIDAIRYENARNTCDIMQNADRNTQRIIDTMTANEIQSLRDQLQTANFQLSQQAQSVNLISTLRPFPQPAYITCSPYTAMNGYGACNCGC